MNSRARSSHWTWLSPLMLAFAAGCGSSQTDGYYESDDPSARSLSSSSSENGAGAADAGSAAAPSDKGGTAGGADAQRAIEEADIIQVDGGRLYALSKYGGLTVVDVSVQDQLKVLGRHRLDAMPFEMYVRNGVVYAMLNGFGRYVTPQGGALYGTWVQTSEIVAVDVSDPAHMRDIASYDVPGEISDSRIVGDALYLVSYENGSCWGCRQAPATVVTSFAVAAGSISKSDQLAYTSPNAGYSWAKRSVSATNQRLYVAGPEWTWSGSGPAHSVIQVIDISDPSGKLVKGADVAIDGEITSRWQMDEYEGVLRVVSQYGVWWRNNSAVNPKVETFRIQSSQQLVRLGSTDLRIPQPESLRTVRFDGARGYAITARQTDPLFTIDVSDPANPKQMGEVAMPGWIYYMEPRGDRLIGLGYDGTNNTGLNVSLFDVSNLAQPKMLKRVSFAPGWAQLAEDQDRIQKSFQVLDDKGLILVPFASYGGWTNGGCTSGSSGIQLIDFSRDDLALRGVAPQHGQPRRSFFVGERLFAMSDRNVTTFKVEDRDRPAKVAEIDLSNPAHHVVSLGSNLAQLTNDWWTGEAMISITPKAGADEAQALGHLSIAELAPNDQLRCGNGSGFWTSWYAARMFTNGSFIYVAAPIYSYGGGYGSQGAWLALGVIDAQDPTQPKIVGKTFVPLKTGPYGYYYSGFYDGYAYYSYGGWAVMGAGSAIVQNGSTLSFIESTRTSSSYDDPTVSRTLHVLDLSNPAAPRESAALDLGNSLGSTPLLLQGNTVLSSRWNSVPGRAGRVRFWIDRVDLSNPNAPRALPSINVPGSLLMADSASGRVVTVDYRRVVYPTTQPQECYSALGYGAYFDYQNKTCQFILRDFKLLDIEGSHATLLQTVNLPAQNLGGVQVGDDRIYVTLYPEYVYAAGPGGSYSTSIRPGTKQGLFVFGGAREGRLELKSSFDGDARWPLAVSGTRVALYRDNGISIYDTASAGAPALVGSADLRGYGYTSDILIEGDRAVCALGEWGLQTIALK